MKKIIITTIALIALAGCSHQAMDEKHHGKSKANADKCEYGGEFYSKGAVVEMAGVKKECKINGNTYPTWNNAFINNFTN